MISSVYKFLGFLTYELPKNFQRITKSTNQLLVLNDYYQTLYWNDYCNVKGNFFFTDGIHI